MDTQSDAPLDRTGRLKQLLRHEAGTADASSLSDFFTNKWKTDADRVKLADDMREFFNRRVDESPEQLASIEAFPIHSL